MLGMLTCSRSSAGPASGTALARSGSVVSGNEDLLEYVHTTPR
jgi:hypothetical protein